MLQRGVLQRRVRQPAGGLAQRGDRGGQVGPPGPDHHLDRAGERVQPPAVGGGQGVLLGGAAQREVHRRHRRHGRGAAGAEADHPVRGDVPPQRRQRRRQRRGRRAGRGGPGRRRRDALGGGDQAARGAGLPPRGGQQPVQAQPVPLADHQGGGGQRDRGGQRRERRQRHDVAGGLERRPDDHGRHRGDGHLPGGQPGQDLVGHLDVGGDGHGVADLIAHGPFPFFPFAEAAPLPLPAAAPRSSGRDPGQHGGGDGEPDGAAQRGAAERGQHGPGDPERDPHQHPQQAQVIRTCSR